MSAPRLARRRPVVDLPPPAPVTIIEHQVYRGWCAYCRAWRAAPLDLGGQVLGRGRLGVGIASLVAHLRLGLRLPVRAIQSYLADLHGLRVSVGELVDLLRRVARAGQAAYARLREQVRTSPAVNGDETGWREAGRNGYVWATCTPAGTRYFEYHHSRAGAVINALLGEDFTGVLTTDFYAAYNDTPGGRHQRCWAHLLRDLHALTIEHANRFEVVVWANAVKALYALAAQVTGPPAERQTAYTQLVAETVRLGQQFADQRDHPCCALAKRLLRHQGELFTFVVVDGVEATNNAAKRAIRPLVVSRKISGGSRSAQGTQTRMTLTSLFQTWQAHRLPPLLEFRRLLQSPLPQI
ncbi:MAG: IS66 family transposase [Streptosporangiaceae bacterium]